MDAAAPLGPSPAEVVYVNSTDVKAALQKHAAENGYSIAVDSSWDERIFYKCSKSGKYRDHKNPDMHDSKRRKNTSTTKTGCPFQVVARKPKG